MDKRSIKKAQSRKKARKVFMSAFIILFIILAGGAFYTWYMGKNVDQSVMIEPFEYEPETTVKHVEQAENVPQGVSIQSLTSTVVPGSNASVIAKTNTKSTCNISVVYDKLVSKDSGLVEKQSDEYGSISWSWTVDSNAPIGKWPVKITCFRTAKPEVSGVAIGKIEIVNEIIIEE